MPSLFITGITSGIGAALLALAHNAGWTITGIVRTQQQKDLLLKQYPERLTLYIADLANPQQVATITSDLKKKAYDYFVCNAGIAKADFFHALPIEHIQETMEVNMLSIARLIHTCMPNIIEHGSKIVCTSSLAAHIPGRGYSMYAASKAALSHFYASLRTEYPAVPMLCIEIGPVATGMHQKANANFASKEKMMDVDVLAARYFKAMQTKTGIVTLSPIWTIGRCIMRCIGPIVSSIFIRRRQ